MITEKMTTLARPYALAAFEYALDKHDLASWETMLKAAAAVATDKEILPMLSSPDMTQKELVEIFSDVLMPMLDKEKKNFLSLLGEYGRLTALPEIANLFSSYRAQQEKTISVQMTSALPLTKAEEQKFVEALTKRLQRKVILQNEVDESLLGGAMLRAGNMVIDGSVRGKLNRLLESL